MGPRYELCRRAAARSRMALTGHAIADGDSLVPNP